MKSKGILVVILSIALILSVTLILVGPVLSKPKPNPNSNPEWITFDGDLEGNQLVEGCCPNAGPCPEYTLALYGSFPPGMQGPHDGNIFMNFFMDLSSKGHGNNKAYIVKFLWTEDNTKYFIVIKGGDIEENKKTKSLTVSFDAEPCEIWVNDLPPEEPVDVIGVSFILTRTPQ